MSNVDRPVRYAAGELSAAVKVAPAAARMASDQFPKRSKAPWNVAPRFPGCDSVRIGRDEIADYEGRYEVWAADTEVAWMVRQPTSAYHEQPVRTLGQSARLIAAIRGAPIDALGTTDLVVRNLAGERTRIMQADEILYLRTGSEHPVDRFVEVGVQASPTQFDHVGPLPDVVLEVDLTTDVRRGKLGLYESCGFPEVWVEVPDRRLPSSRRTDRGLTIYVRGPEGYRESPASVAFAGWTAAEIHTAVNEAELSAATTDALRRVGRQLAKSIGTGPDRFLQAERDVGKEQGLAEGRAEGHHNAMAFAEILGSRGVLVTLAVSRQFMQFADPGPALLRAAMECRNEDDLLRRMRAMR